MGPVGRVPSNFGDRGDQLIWSSPQLLQLAVVFRRMGTGQCGDLTALPGRPSWI